MPSAKRHHHYAQAKKDEWSRYRNQHREESFFPIKPLMLRCDRCHNLDLIGYACPDCALRRSIIFLDVYGAQPDTEPYSVPRSQRGRYLSPVKGVTLPGYPHDFRKGAPKRNRGGKYGA